MDNTNNAASVLAAYKSYLTSQMKGSVTVKSYSQDVARYLKWGSITHIDKLSLSSTLLDQYFIHLSEKNFQQETLRRAKASLTSFISFCISQGWITDNPLKHVARSDSPFINYLRGRGVSDASARQYASEVKLFERWLSVSTSTHG